MDKDLQALIEDSFQDRQLLQRERIFAYQCIFIMAFTTDSLCSAFNSFWMVSTYLGSARSTCSGSANSVFFLLVFVVVPGIQWDVYSWSSQAANTTKPLQGRKYLSPSAVAGAMKTSQKVIVPFSCFRFFMSQVLIHSVFFLEWNFLTPPHDSNMRQAAKDHCQSDADLVARLKAFQSHFHLFPSFWLMKMVFPVRLKWLQGDYDCMEVSRRIWCFFSIRRVVCLCLFETNVSKENESWPPVAEKEIICKSDMLCNWCIHYTCIIHSLSIKKRISMKHHYKQFMKELFLTGGGPLAARRCNNGPGGKAGGWQDAHQTK